MTAASCQSKLGHYRLLRKLGEGGMGIVYLAEDARLQRQVAIKCLKQDGMAQEYPNTTSISRLRREATALAQLNHPNVVQIYDLIETEEDVAIVMECIDGGTLTKHVREQVVSLKQRLVWLQQIAEGLSAAHDQGLVHRDLKFDNVLINSKNIAKITDFGIARKNNSDLTVTSQLVGSYSTLSPEQALGQPVDHRSDLFSFGILAFKLLCGRHPFSNSENQIVMIQSILQQPHLSAQSLNPSLDSRLVVLLNQLLQKSPTDRPVDAHVVSNQLQRIIDDVSGDAEPFDSGTLDIDWMKAASIRTTRRPNRRVLYGVGVGLLMLLLIGSAWYWLRYDAGYDNDRYVAVLPPRVLGDNDLNATVKTLIAETINDALQHQVMNTERLNLVSPQLVSQTQGSYSKRASAVGADVLVETTVQCEWHRCAVQLIRLEPGSPESMIRDDSVWVVKARESWPIVIDKQYLNLAQDFQQRLAALFPERDSTTEFNPIREDAYQRFLQYRFAVLNNGQDTPEMWTQLWNAQRQYQRYLPYYQLMSYLGRLLYDDSGDTRYLTQLTELLNHASQEPTQKRALLPDLIEVALREQAFEKADSLHQQMVDYGVDKADQLTYQALIANFKGEYRHADRLYRQALALRPTTALWYRIANNHFHQGDNQAALTALTALLKLDENNFDAKILMASVHLLRGEIEEAIHLYHDLIAISPKSQFYSNVGIAYELQGNYPDAERYFTKALQLSPTMNALRLNLADVLQLKGDTHEAEIRYRQIIESSSSTNQDWKEQIIVAQAEMQLGHTREAFHAIHRSIQLSGDNAEVLYSAALVYSLAHQWAVALNYIEQSLALGLSSVWYNLAWFNGLCEVQKADFNALLNEYAASNGETESPPRCE